MQYILWDEINRNEAIRERFEKGETISLPPRIRRKVGEGDLLFLAEEWSDQNIGGNRITYRALCSPTVQEEVKWKSPHLLAPDDARAFFRAVSDRYGMSLKRVRKAEIMDFLPGASDRKAS